MSDSREKPRPFDVHTIEFLVKLMTDNDLSEIDLSEGDERIRLRRGPRVAFAAAAMAQPAPVAQTPVASAATPPADPPKPAKNLLDIKSPAPGTFYAQREPGSPPLVTVGSRVGPTTAVGVLMAMKVQSDIEARCTGTIAEVCVKNEDPVEYNTVLFRVDPS